MNWFHISHRPGFALVSITGEIGTHSQTAQDFAAELGTASRVELMLDCCGGDGHAGMELFKILSARDTTAFVTGLCCSAACLPLLACKTIQAAPSARFMLHAPSRWICATAGALRSAADELDKLKEDFARIVSDRTRQPRRTVDGWLSERETWFDAEQALAVGLVDAIVSPPSLPERTETAQSGTEAPAQDEGPTEDEAFALDMLRLTTGLHVRNRQRFAQQVALWLQSTREV